MPVWDLKFLRQCVLYYILLGYDTVWFGRRLCLPTFPKDVLPPSPGLAIKNGAMSQKTVILILALWLSTKLLKCIGWVEIKIHVFLTSAQIEGEWPAPCYSPITPGKKSAYNPSWESRLDRLYSCCELGVDKNRKFFPYLKQNLTHPACNHSLFCMNYPHSKQTKTKINDKTCVINTLKILLVNDINKQRSALF